VTRTKLALLAVLAAVATSAAGGGCDCGKKKPAAKQEPAPESDEGDEVAEAPDRERPRPRMPDRRPSRDLSGRVRNNAPLSIEDADKAMPKLDARTLAKPALSPNGRQVRFTYCVDAEDINAAASSLVTSLQRASWMKVTSRAPDEATTVARHGIAAEKGDLRLAITLQATRRTGCDSSVNQFFATASMNRIAQSPSDEPAP
jgi:hypothetical protein